MADKQIIDKTAKTDNSGISNWNLWIEDNATGGNPSYRISVTTFLTDFIENSFIKDFAVTNNKISSMDGSKLYPLSVDTGQIANNAIDNDKIEDNAVTNSKISDNQITESKTNFSKLLVGTGNTSIANYNFIVGESNDSGSSMSVTLGKNASSKVNNSVCIAGDQPPANIICNTYYFTMQARSLSGANTDLTNGTSAIFISSNCRFRFSGKLLVTNENDLTEYSLYNLEMIGLCDASGNITYQYRNLTHVDGTLTGIAFVGTGSSSGNLSYITLTGIATKTTIYCVNMKMTQIEKTVP